MSKARDLADFISTGSILSDGTIESTEISGVTADATEINKLDGLTADTTELNKLDGVTATTDELNKLAGTTATTSDFDKLSNVTASATELNYMTGATSSIQSQLDNISVTSGSLTKTFTNGESATITLAQSITPAPVVSVTKEVAQTGQSSKGAWDVNATASNYDLHNTAYSTTLAKSVVYTGTAYGTSPLGSAITYTNSSTGASGLNARAFGMSSDGTKAIVIGDGAYMHSLSLSTAFDISTASVTVSNGPSGWPSNSLGGYVKSDGTKMWVVDYSQGSFTEFNLNTAWDVSSKSSVATYTTNVPSAIIDVYWKPDGMMCFIADYQNADIYQFTVTTAFDFSTAGTPYTYSMTSTAGDLMNIQFKPDGTELYASINQNTSYNVLKLSLSTAWDLSGTVTESAHVADLSASPFSVNINIGFFEYYNNGGAIFYAPYGNDTITQFNVQTSSTGLTLGTGSFASTDVGKRIQGNGGDVILTSTAGVYDTTGGSDFTDTSTIASGSWTMHGLKSAGADDGLTIAGITGDPYDFNNATLAATATLHVDAGHDAQISPDGTKFVHAANTSPCYFASYTMSTPFDISTLTNVSFVQKAVASTSSFVNDQPAIAFNPAGTIAGVATDESHRLGHYTLTTPFDMSSATLAASWDPGSSLNFKSLTYNGDGSVAYVFDINGGNVRRYGMASGNEYKLGTTGSGDHLGNTSTSSMGASFTYFYSMHFNSDGTKFFASNSSTAALWNLSTPYDLSTATHVLNYTLPSSGSISMTTPTGNYHYLANSGQTTMYSYRLQSLTQPTSQYHIGVTNASGQIDSAYWTDINSMTADQSLGDGEAYYAVSTDDRTTWSVAKGSDGVRPIVRDNSGTWQYNSENTVSQVGYDIANTSYDNKTITIANNINGMEISSDGTRIYYVENNGVTYQKTLSTAFDISTAGSSTSLATNSQDVDPRDITFSSDGTIMYLLGDANNSVFQYTLSTAWDITTGTYANKSFSVGSQDTSPFSLQMKSDGTKLYVMGISSSAIYEYNLSTAYDISTASYSSNSFSITSPQTQPRGIALKPDGTKMYLISYDTQKIHELEFGTNFDVSTLSYTSNEFSHNTQTTNGRDVTFSSDGTKMYILAFNGGTYQYSTGTTSYPYSTTTTWADASTNDEFYALQQALGIEQNRMDKTQLDAVADGSHFTLGDTLDLMIALKQDTASASLPTSDGVTINYDAEALNQGAVLGTDYDFDFPANNKVRITSNAAQNLKIRVV